MHTQRDVALGMILVVLGTAQECLDNGDRAGFIIELEKAERLIEPLPEQFREKIGQELAVFIKQPPTPNVFLTMRFQVIGACNYAAAVAQENPMSGRSLIQ